MGKISFKKKVLAGMFSFSTFLFSPINCISAELIHESTDFPERNVQFIYIADDAYRFYITTDRITEIRLQPGESLVTIFSGTTDGLAVNNMLTKNDSGQVYETIFIKPTKPELSTNLSIVTDKRLYRLLVVTDEKFYNPIVSWRYLLDEEANRRRLIAKIKEELAVIPPILKLTKDNFKYIVTCDKESYSVKPTMVYSYEGKMYIKMPERITSENLPVLFVVNNKKLELANYRFRQGYFIVDRLADELHLIYSGEKVVIQTVQFYLEKNKKGAEKKRE